MPSGSAFGSPGDGGGWHRGGQTWAPAACALEAAIAKGGVRDLGNLYLLLGTAEHSAGRRGAAEAAFETARGFERTREAAEPWLVVVRGTDR